MVVGFDLYKLAAGWNNAAGFALLDPQPQGIQQQVTPGLVRDALDGSNAEDGLHFPLFWQAMSKATLTSLLTQCSLSTSVSYARVTLSLKRFDAYVSYNGVIHRPVFGKTMKRGLNGWRDVTFLVTHLVAI